jgi:hypothetical protein
MNKFIESALLIPINTEENLIYITNSITSLGESLLSSIRSSNSFKKNSKSSKPSLLNLSYSLINTARHSLLKLESFVKRSLKQSLTIFPFKLFEETSFNCTKASIFFDSNHSTLSLLLMQNILSSKRLAMKKLHHIQRSTKNKLIAKKLNSIMNQEDFDSKIVFRMIRKKSTPVRPNFILQPNPSKPHSPSIITQENLVIEAVHNHHSAIFKNTNSNSSVSDLLINVPTIPSNYLQSKPDFSSNNIKQFILSRSDTSPGVDGITYSLFKFLIKRTNSKILDLLSSIFNFCYQHSVLPEKWKEGITHLIPKDQTFYNLNNWRPITLLNTMYKTYTLILNQALQITLTSSNIIPNEQCGFLPNKDTSVAVNSYLEVLKLSNLLKLPLHVMYIDFSKAFDTIQHSVLLEVLTHLKIESTMIKAIFSLLKGAWTRFLTQYGPTQPVEFQVGTKQGDPISPLLFLICLLPLQWSLKQLKINVNLFCSINHLCFADDLLLMASSVNHLNQLYKLVEQFSSQSGLTINPLKSAYSSLNDNTSYNPTFLNQPIKKISSSSNYKYLGLWINLKLNWSFLLKEEEKKYSNKLHIIISKHYLSTKLKIKLINTVAQTPLAYILQFILLSPSTCNRLDKETISLLNKDIHMPKNSTPMDWHTYRGLKSFKSLAHSRYLSSKLDRGLNSLTPFVSQVIMATQCIFPTTPPSFLLPSVKETLNELNLTLTKTTPCPSQTFQLPNFPDTPAFFWTDASLIITPTQIKGAGAIWSPIYGSNIVPMFGYPSSTHFELQTIDFLLKSTLNIPLIHIFTDSLPSIQTISSFPHLNHSKQLKLEAYPTLKSITTILQLRKSLNFKEEFFHVNSHLLDKKKPLNAEKKLKAMKLKFPNNWEEILQGNQIVDRLAYHNIKPISAYPLTNSNLPPFIITDSPNFSICTNKIINKLFQQKMLDQWKKHAPKRSEWFFSQDIDLSGTKILPSNLTDHLQRITQSLLPTRERLHKFFIRPNHIIHPVKLAHLRKIYNSDSCHLCTQGNLQMIDNHQHILSSCSLALEMDLRLKSSLSQLIRHYSYQTGGLFSPAPSLIPEKWIARGQIPKSFRTSVSQLKSKFTVNSLIQAVTLLTSIVAKAKWTLKCHSIYHPEDNIAQILAKPQFNYLTSESLFKQAVSLLSQERQ